VRSIGLKDLQALLDTGTATLVEALPQAQYQAEHIPGAVNLPGDLTEQIAGQLVPNRHATVVTYCSGQFCGRSRTAAAVFERLGYADVRLYEGGKADWTQAGLPLQGTRTNTGNAARAA
jgi:rhodanese-related sulfurtransferase